MSDTARDQAIAQVSSICAMVAALEVDYDRLEELTEEREDWTHGYRLGDDVAPGSVDLNALWAAENPSDADELAELAEAAGDCEDADEARRTIEEDALSVEVRSGWSNVGEESLTPEEFRIVLCTGGPHVELVGELDHHLKPTSVRVLFQWGWGEAGELFDFARDAVLTYCRCFYFGE